MSFLSGFNRRFTRALPAIWDGFLPYFIGLGLIGGMLWLVADGDRFFLEPRETSTAVPADLETRLAEAQKTAVIVGTVVDRRGRLVGNAQVTARSFLSTGTPLSTRSVLLQNGIFSLSFPRELLTEPHTYGVLVTAETDFYIASSAETVVTITPAQAAAPATAAAQQPVLRIVLRPLNPFLTFLICVPGIFGIILSVIHVTRITPTMAFTVFYAVGTSLLWAAVVMRLTLIYTQSGDNLIPLFWTDVNAHSGIVVFSFMGSLVYAAYSVFEKPADFFTSPNIGNRQKYLLTLGGRILSAPYVALVAFTLFASTFESLQLGSFALFLSFFTGLFIPAVLQVLNDVGSRMLNAESQSKLLERFQSKRDAGPAIPSQSAADIRPSGRLLDAVRAAQALVADPQNNVIGVAPGTRRQSSVDTQEPAVIVYVDKKSPDPATPVPTQIGGVRTDVQPLPQPHADEMCFADSRHLSWPKVHQLTEARRTKVGPADSLAIRDDANGVFLLPDPAGEYFSLGLFSPITAYRDVVVQLGDRYDFVAFYILPGGAIPASSASYYVPLFNDIDGIAFFKERILGHRFDERSLWAAPAPIKLRGCQVYYPPLDVRKTMHEIGHCWSMYVPIEGLCDVTEEHWHRNTDNGNSCMDHDHRRWVAGTKAGHFVNEPVRPEEFDFAPLDRYLMGLVGADAVGPIQIIQPTGPADAAGEVPATVRTVGISEILLSAGVRRPPVSTTLPAYRQAFVIVGESDTACRAEGARLKANNFFSSLETAFARATGGATLRAGLV